MSARVALVALLTAVLWACGQEEESNQGTAHLNAGTGSTNVAPLDCAPNCPNFEQAIVTMLETVRGGSCIEHEVGHCGTFRYVRQKHSLGIETQFFGADGALVSEHYTTNERPDNPLQTWSGEELGGCERVPTEHVCGTRMVQVLKELRNHRAAFSSCGAGGQYSIDVSVETSGRIASVEFENLDAESRPAHCLRELLSPWSFGPGPAQRFRIPF